MKILSVLQNAGRELRMRLAWYIFVSVMLIDSHFPTLYCCYCIHLLGIKATVRHLRESKLQLDTWEAIQ